MEKAAFNNKKEKTIFMRSMDFQLRKKPVNATFGAQLCVVMKLGHIGQ
jgi:hypothetical protein